VNARRPIEKGHGSFGHYGLPVDRPVDRHKWFFSLTEAIEFFDEHAGRGEFEIGSLHATEKPRPSTVVAARKVRYNETFDYLNRYAHTLWAVLKTS
jgi:hypothetical protein